MTEKTRTTSFGEMKAIDLGERKIEWLKMTSEGSPHVHEHKQEHGVILEGTGFIITQIGRHESETLYRPGQHFQIGRGVRHWMRPEGDTPFEFLIWYKVLT